MEPLPGHIRGRLQLLFCIRVKTPKALSGVRGALIAAQPSVLPVVDSIDHPQVFREMLKSFLTLFVSPHGFGDTPSLFWRTPLSFPFISFFFCLRTVASVLFLLLICLHIVVLLVFILLLLLLFLFLSPSFSLHLPFPTPPPPGIPPLVYVYGMGSIPQIGVWILALFFNHPE